MFDADVDLSELDIRLAVRATVTGFVVDARGDGMAHAPVTVYSEESGRRQQVEWTRADSGGQFRIDTLEPGRYLIGTLSLDSFPFGALRTQAKEQYPLLAFSVKESEQVDVGALNGSWFTVVKGRVFSEDGEGLGRRDGAFVGVVARTDLDGYRPGAGTMPDGRFFLDVLRNAFPCVLYARLDLDILTDEVVLNHPPESDIVLIEAGSRQVGTLVVRVFDPAGKPLHDFDVLLDGDAGGISRDLGRTFRNAAAGGHWAGLISGTYRLRIQVGSHMYTHGFIKVQVGEKVSVSVTMPE
jgi:hypothetical protein